MHPIHPLPGLLLAEVQPSQFEGINGFLGTRASLMLDVVFLAMFVVIPVMAWSIYQVKYHRRYSLHKRVQVILGVVLLIAVVAFEVDMRLNDWTPRAEPSPYWNGGWSDVVHISLIVHLFFAIPTTFLWIFVIVQALRRFAKPPEPNEYSPKHRFWARLAAIEMTLTAITGWVFYWLAFAAS